MRNFDGIPGRKKEARALLTDALVRDGETAALVDRVAEMMRRREHRAYLHALHVVEDAETRERAAERLREIVGATDAA